MPHYRRLPLEGLLNARDLGGYPTPGGVTKYGIFIRSELPHSLTKNDLDFLQMYGLKTVIDLRGRLETEMARDVLADTGWITYLHVSLNDEASARGAATKKYRMIDNDFTWGSHYVLMAENNKAWFAKALNALAQPRDGAVLYHCTTGKDRAGLITAALYGLCGVSDADIAADYCISQIHLRPFYLTMEHLMAPDGKKRELSDPFFSTSPDNMYMFLSHINGKYGCMRGYLESCGILPETLDFLNERLTGADKS